MGYNRRSEVSVEWIIGYSCSIIYIVCVEIALGLEIPILIY